jgi:hypothetical protein
MCAEPYGGPELSDFTAYMPRTSIKLTCFSQQAAADWRCVVVAALRCVALPIAQQRR